jgi:hypothetical protein
MNSKKIKIILFLIVILLGAGVIVYVKKIHRPAPPGNDAFKSYVDPQTQTGQTPEKPEPATIADKVFLKIPFTPQAPTANWDQLHNEACEEASAIMAYTYFSGMKNEKLEPKFVEGEITKLTDWETKNFGYHLDTTSAETARMIETVYGLHTKLISNFTEDDIKKALAADQVVAISENGRQVGNPNYKSPGPVHHSLIIKGYDAKGFITNDSGTRNGLNYRYSFTTLNASAADWDHSTNNVDGSKKIAIIISR